MGWWQVNADTLAESRFVISPLAEATASLIALDAAAAAHPGERAWLDAHQPAYRERLASDPVTALLVRAALGRHWIADFFTIAPTGEGEPTFGRSWRGSARRRRRSPARTCVSLGGPLPAAAPVRSAGTRRGPAGVGVDATVLPYWPRRRRIIEADIVARTAQLSQGGWAAALNDMRPGMRWLGEGRLQINAYDYPPREICRGAAAVRPGYPGPRLGRRGTSRTGTR